MFIKMNDFGTSLFEELSRLEREMNARNWPSNIRSAARGDYPPINVGSNAEQIDVYLFLPGVDADAVELNIQQNLLTIAGERRLIGEEGAEYFRKERFDGGFRRVVSLPEDIDPDSAAASYKNGVLHVRVSRHEATRPRQIKVS
jgi:HSP20 family protein